MVTNSLALNDQFVMYNFGGHTTRFSSLNFYPSLSLATVSKSRTQRQSSVRKGRVK